MKTKKIKRLRRNYSLPEITLTRLNMMAAGAGHDETNMIIFLINEAFKKYVNDFPAISGKQEIIEKTVNRFNSSTDRLIVGDPTSLPEAGSPTNGQGNSHAGDAGVV